MKPVPEPDDDPIDRITDIPRILEALRLGVQDALRRHKRAGESVVVWRDGQVVWLTPEEIPYDLPPHDYTPYLGKPDPSEHDPRHTSPSQAGSARSNRSPLPVIDRLATGIPIPAVSRNEIARIESDEDIAKHNRSLGR